MTLRLVFCRQCLWDNLFCSLMADRKKGGLLPGFGVISAENAFGGTSSAVRWLKEGWTSVLDLGTSAENYCLLGNLFCSLMADSWP